MVLSRGSTVDGKTQRHFSPLARVPTHQGTVGLAQSGTRTRHHLHQGVAHLPRLIVVGSGAVAKNEDQKVERLRTKYAFFPMHGTGRGVEIERKEGS
jgi:hypothetical protein